MSSDRSNLATSTSQISSDLGLSAIIDLIAETLGINIPIHHQDDLKKRILARINALKLSSFSDYYNYLLLQGQLLPATAEWQGLISFLSVTESYFFRDQGQFWLLRNQILPQLIEYKRQLHITQGTLNQKPALRIWSAGCSTGEEAYSLAISLKELIPDYSEWDILILGTDINQSAIALAQQGFYRDWSFRTTDPAIRTRYFQPHKDGWKIDASIRQMVIFQHGNLVQSSYPNYTSKIYDLDLILCRNVFIYFDSNAIAKVLTKFYHSLAPGGFLLTGHTELHGQKFEIFQVKSFPQSVVYQRESQRETAHSGRLTHANSDPSKYSCYSTPLQEEREIAEKKNIDSNSDNYLASQPSIKVRDPNLDSQPYSTLEEELAIKMTRENSLFNKAKKLLAQKSYVDAIQTAKQLIDIAPKHFQAYCLNAEAYANLGNYSDASQACHQALQINPLAIEPCYLLAQIAEEQGDIESTKLFLKRIIYLVPSSISAYLELGSIYEQENNTKQAQKTWRSLLEILQDLPQEQTIDLTNQQTIADLKIYVLKHLSMEAKQTI